MKVVFVLLAGMFAATVNAQEAQQSKQPNWNLVKLDYLGVEYSKIRNYRDAYFPEFTTIDGECQGINRDGTPSDECYSYGAKVKFDLSLVRVRDLFNVYWDNDVNMDATQKQVRRVGWNWHFGVDFGKLQLGTEHFSSHYLDGESSVKFKLYDAYVVKFDVYGSKK